MRLAKGRIRASSIIPSEAQKYLSIVPRGIEKAGKKSLTSYRMAAPLFQLIVDTVLWVATFSEFGFAGAEQADFRAA